MKAKTVRLLAGGLAAVTLMSNMAVMPIYASEAQATDTVVTESVLEESYDFDAQDSAAESVCEGSQDAAEAEADAEAQIAEEPENEADGETEAGMTDATAAEAETANEAEAEKTDTAETEAQTANEAAEDAEAGKADAEAQAANEAADDAEAEKADAAGTKENESTILISAQSDMDSDLLSEDDEDEPMLGMAAPSDGAEAGSSAEVEAANKQAEESKKLAQAEADKLLGEVKSPQDILKLFDALDSMKKMKAELSEAAQKETNPAAAKVKSNTVMFCEGLFKEAVGTALKEACGKIPGASFVAGPLKDLIMRSLGFQSDSAKMSKGFTDTQNKIDELKGETLRGMENVGSIGIYGTRLDDFTNSATSLASTMALYQNDAKMTENEKNIRIASIIGGSDKWHAGESNIFSKMHAASMTMRSKSHEGPQADTKERNLFDVFYDYNKETSLFSGEAMAKANTSIKKRTEQYVANCRVLAEVLKAHEKVAEMSDKEVAELSPEMRKEYEKIKTDKAVVRTHMKAIVETFTGNKNADDKRVQMGIFDALKEYAGQDKLVYLEKKGSSIAETKFNNKLYTQNSEDYNQKDLESRSALNRDQVIKLQEHINSLGLTAKEYLTMLGFDMSEVNNTNRSVYLSTLDSYDGDPIQIAHSSPGLTVSPVTTTRYRSGYYKGFDINAKGTKEANRKYVDYTRYDSNTRDNVKLDGGLNIVLRTQAAVNKDKAEQLDKWYEQHMDAATKKLIHPPTEEPKEPTFVDKLAGWIKSWF